MCYTCPYSVCKRCVRSSEYVLVRENKGFCGICMKTIMLIENAPEANKDKVRVNLRLCLCFSSAMCLTCTFCPGSGRL